MVLRLVCVYETLLRVNLRWLVCGVYETLLSLILPVLRFPAERIVGKAFLEILAINTSQPDMIIDPIPMQKSSRINRS